MLDPWSSFPCACRRLAPRYGTLVGLWGAAPAGDGQARFEPQRRHRAHARTDDGFDLDARVHIGPPTSRRGTTAGASGSSAPARAPRSCSSGSSVPDRAQARRSFAHLARPHEFAPARDPTLDFVA